MFKKCNHLLWTVTVFLIGFTANVWATGETGLILNPISDSTNVQKYAAATFLPEFKDSEFGWTVTRPDGPNVDFCKDYPLTSCPDNAECSDCPTNKSYHKLLRCKSGFQNQGNSCIASSCQASGYEADIPANQICTKITQGGLTCYKDCRAISCTGYTLDCDNFNVANSNSKETCPDCSSSGSNCSPKLCKVSSCQNGYKIADNGTTCIALDDTCPNGYYNECETGTEGDPEYTEKGTACYLCKAKTPETGCPLLTPAEKCIEEGYKTMDDWQALSPNDSGYLKPDGGNVLTPEDTRIPVFSFNSLDIKNSKSTKLAYWFKEILGIKSASATSVISICDSCRLTGCRDANCLSACPSACEMQIQPMIRYVFDQTAVCPYDSSYVKGVWTKVNTETELPPAMLCSSNQTRMLCNGITYCCTINPGSCSNLASNQTCYSRACATEACLGYNDSIAKTGTGWTSESCRPVSGNCTKQPYKYKNTCKSSILYTLSTCPANTRCVGDCNNKFKVIGCDCGYTLQNGKCIKGGDTTDEITPQEPAYPLPVLYSDMTTSRELVANKTPIGVVFDESRKLAVALNTAQKAWATSAFDIPNLTNYKGSTVALTDWNGKANTKTIIDYCKTNSKSCPAAEYANSYITAGTSSGDWYWPALGELNALYNTKEKANKTLDRIGGIVLSDTVHWSSSEGGSPWAWAQSISDGTVVNTYPAKGLLASIRPIINYGDVNKGCYIFNCSECESGRSDYCQTCDSGYELDDGFCGYPCSSSGVGDKECLLNPSFSTRYYDSQGTCYCENNQMQVFTGDGATCSDAYFSLDYQCKDWCQNELCFREWGEYGEGWRNYLKNNWDNHVNMWEWN